MHGVGLINGRKFSHPPFPLLLFLLLAVIFGSLIGSAIVYGLSASMGMDLFQVLETMDESSPPKTRNFIRLANLISHFLTFTVPVLGLVFYLFRDHWKGYLKLDRFPQPAVLGLAILFIMAAFPVAQTSYWLNQQLPIPDWALQMENSATGMLKSLLIMDSPYELFFNLLVVAVLPALGEELLFRGVVQKNIQDWSKRPHLSVWITAIIFSSIHMQFEGFLPRMLVGAALGYLFLWTRNLWVPILAHLVFNGSQILAHYFSTGDTQALNLEEVEGPQWAFFIMGLGILLVSGYYIRSLSKTEEELPLSDPLN